jgi:hypothetical protein
MRIDTPESSVYLMSRGRFRVETASRLSICSSTPINSPPLSSAAMNGSTFAGTIKFTDDSAGNVRQVNQNGWRGSQSVTFDLGNGTVFIGPRNRSLITYLGAIIGGPNTALNGPGAADQIDDPDIYVLGGKNLDTEFQGTINDSTPGNGGAPRLVKIWKEGTGKLTLSVVSPEAGTATEELLIDYKAAAIEIGFNARYIMDILERIEGAKAIFLFSDAGSPTLVRDSDGEAALYVLMPMRV